MKFTIVTLALTMVGYANAQFAATFSLACDIDNFVVTISDAASTGEVYIEGMCGAQGTSQGTSIHTFNAATCTDGGFPTLLTPFSVVVQEFVEMSLYTDTYSAAICYPDLTGQSVTLPSGVGVTEDITAGASTGSVAPTFTVDLVGTNGNTLSVGVIGTAATLKITMDSKYQADFDFKINSITTNSLQVVSNGCPLYSVLDAPSFTSTNGVHTWSFDLFIPTTNIARSSTAVTITATLDICYGSCTPYSCGERRRRSTDDSTITNTTLTTRVVVLPQEYLNTMDALSENLQNNEDDDLCITQTSMVALLVGLILALLICLVLTAVMFVKLRDRRQRQDKQIYGIPNVSYEK